MKKILVLVCVLCAVSTANAGLRLDIEGAVIPGGSSLKMNVGDVITLQVVGESPVPVNAALYIGVFGDAVSIDGHTMVYGGNLSSYLDLDDAVISFGYDSTDDMLEEFAAYGLEGITDISVITLADGSANPAPLTGLLVGDIILTADKIGTSNIQLLDQDLATIGTIAWGIQVVPEPMTIAFLGLGGLFLRRRK